MTQPSALSAELLKFIHARRGLSSTQALSLSSSLERDLGLTGDNAAYFMEAYFEQFHVEVGDFNFPRYFVEESARDRFFF
ncbi:DUF1493 family protein [Caballeronia grimmiae]|uniref:Uncharacterized protein n=1 Tax=Caballeronia grimmiae TaxID=1071679 RepID=A0A069NAF5_9BURK|nr:DUF1493 family protein [Caballeronia grimmiae]KDR25413.1 hypothetical protein BG57_30560 [Caballeronia grimmiae]GGD80261.1 hypothetical protein GCM10010985_38470 [Caballeronia grimmiae]